MIRPRWWHVFTSLSYGPFYYTDPTRGSLVTPIRDCWIAFTPGAHVTWQDVTFGKLMMELGNTHPLRGFWSCAVCSIRKLIFCNGAKLVTRIFLHAQFWTFVWTRKTRNEHESLGLVGIGTSCNSHDTIYGHTYPYIASLNHFNFKLIHHWSYMS